MKPTLELDNLSVGYGRRVLLKDLCASILPGQILTLIGPNGAGKSTILKTISHHLACMGGVVRIGGENIERMDSCELAKRLSVVLTERVRPELMTCYDVAASGRYPYTGRFGMLTALDRDVIAQSLALVRVEELADKPFARVSDGQRQRVMIARALCQQPRVLVLDEPTNDLDIDSLEMLEQTLATYPGTIILVSHDRRFLDNVVTEVLAPEGNGLWREYVGGYSDWLQQRPEPVEPAAPAAPQPKAAAKPRPRDNKIRMSYKETQELERLPKLIEDLEAEQAALMEAMSAPDYHTKSVEELRKDAERAKAIEDEIASSYERWEALEEKRQLAENQ